MGELGLVGRLWSILCSCCEPVSEGLQVWFLEENVFDGRASWLHEVGEVRFFGPVLLPTDTPHSALLSSRVDEFAALFAEIIAVCC